MSPNLARLRARKPANRTHLSRYELGFGEMRAGSLRRIGLLALGPRTRSNPRFIGVRRLMDGYGLALGACENGQN